MNNQLWNSIRNYHFDQMDEEYSFTIRLAKENFWTIEFTKTALSIFQIAID